MNGKPIMYLCIERQASWIRKSPVALLTERSQGFSFGQYRLGNLSSSFESRYIQ